MDGKGRAIDNVMVERFVANGEVRGIYLKSYASGADCHAGLKAYFHYYTHDRPTRAWATGHPGKPSKSLSETDPPTI